MTHTYTLAELAEAVDGTVRGDATRVLSGVASVDQAGPDEITWVGDARYADKLSTSRAGAVIVPADFGETPMPALLVADPNVTVIGILTLFAPLPDHPPPGVHPTAVVAPSAKLGDSAAVGPHVVVGEGAVIGDRTVCCPNVVIGAETTIGRDCVLWPGVVVRERCQVGNEVVLHPNVTIGADGFGYHFTEGRHVKIPQIGTVVIEDRVEIGAGSCVDRAKYGQTRIGEGSKIDNQVQIAHNVEVGPHCVIVAQTGIAGSATVGAFGVLGGGVGVRDHVHIGERVRAAAFTGITKDVPAGKILNGNPAVDSVQHFREKALIHRLPDYVRLIKELSRRVEQLEAAADD